MLGYLYRKLVLVIFVMDIACKAGLLSTLSRSACVSLGTTQVAGTTAACMEYGCCLAEFRDKGLSVWSLREIHTHIARMYVFLEVLGLLLHGPLLHLQASLSAAIACAYFDFGAMLPNRFPGLKASGSLSLPNKTNSYISLIASLTINKQ